MPLALPVLDDMAILAEVVARGAARRDIGGRAAPRPRVRCLRFVAVHRASGRLLPHARRLGNLRTAAFASPEYLGRRGAPESPGDLAGHECIVLAEPGSEEVWFFREGKAARAVPVSGRLRVPSLRAGQPAARAGLGIVRLPSTLAAEDARAGRLLQVLANATPPGLPVFALFRGGRHVPLKVRAFLDLLAQRGAAVPWDLDP